MKSSTVLKWWTPIIHCESIIKTCSQYYRLYQKIQYNTVQTTKDGMQQVMPIQV
jgi:hypothetical protein